MNEVKLEDMSIDFDDSMDISKLDQTVQNTKEGIELEYAREDIECGEKDPDGNKLNTPRFVFTPRLDVRPIPTTGILKGIDLN